MNALLQAFIEVAKRRRNVCFDDVLVSPANGKGRNI